MGCLLAFQAAVPLQKPITGNVTEDVVREQLIRAVTLEGTQAKRGSAELTRETKQNNGAVEVLKSEALTAPDVKVTVPPSATDAGDPVSLKDGNGEVIKTEVPVPVLKVATTDRTIDDAKTQTEFETTVAETPFASSAVSNWSLHRHDTRQAHHRRRRRGVVANRGTELSQSPRSAFAITASYGVRNTHRRTRTTGDCCADPLRFARSQSRTHAVRKTDALLLVNRASPCTCRKSPRPTCEAP